ncbi:MAG: hypothetical protein ACRYFS_24585 [Janthinobacterium lividum]
MIPQTDHYPNMDFPPTDRTTGSYRCRTTLTLPVFQFSDTDLIVSMGVWLYVVAGWRSQHPLDFLTVEQAEEASIMLRQALRTQPKDLARIIDETDFEDGAYPLLRSAWHPDGALPAKTFWEALHVDFLKLLPVRLLIAVGIVLFLRYVMLGVGDGQ